MKNVDLLKTVKFFVLILLVGAWSDYIPAQTSDKMNRPGMLFYEPAPDNPAADVWCFKKDSLWYVYTLDGFGQSSIGVAVSADLMTYERRGVAIPSESGTWENSLFGGDVFKWKGKNYMLYSAPGPGYDNAIGLAESEDLVEWVKYPGNPVMRHPDARWYDGSNPDGMRGGTSCRDVTVIEDASTGEWVYCCFTASTGRGDFYRRGCIGLARSKNLTDWEYLPPLFSPGIYTAMEVPRVCKIGRKWFLTWLHAPWYGIRTDEDFGQRAYSWGETMIHYAVADNPLGPYHLPKDPTLFRGYFSPYVIDLLLENGEVLITTTMFKQQGKGSDARERCGLMPAMLVRQAESNEEKLEVYFPENLRGIFNKKISFVEPLLVNNSLPGFLDVEKKRDNFSFTNTSNRVVELTGATNDELLIDLSFNLDSGRAGLITRYDEKERRGCIVLVDPIRKELQFAELAPIYEKGLMLKVRERFDVTSSINRQFKLSIIQSVNYHVVFIDNVYIGAFSFELRDKGAVGLFLENASGSALIEGIHAH